MIVPPTPRLVTTVALAALLFCGAANAQVISDFECQPAGFQFGSPDCDGWTLVSGTAVVCPDPAMTHPPCANMPSSGSQWLEISNIGLGPANPVVPPSTPGVFPFTANTVAEMKISTVALTNRIAVDWYFGTDEGANGSALFGGGFDDFAQVVVVDPATGSVIGTVHYVDTYPPFVPTFIGCTSATGGLPAINQIVAQTHAETTIPNSFTFQPIDIHVIVANQGDNSGMSFLWLDDLRFLPNPYPGSGDDLTLRSSVGVGTVDPLVTSDPIKSAPPASFLSLHYESPGGTLDLLPPFLAGSLIAPGMPGQAFPTFPYIHLDPQTSFVLIDGSIATPIGPLELLIPGGITHTFVIPGGLAGIAAMFQVFVVSPQALNGAFAVTGGHEIQFVP